MNIVTVQASKTYDVKIGKGFCRTRRTGSGPFLPFSAIRISQVGEMIHPRPEKSAPVEQKSGCG